VYLFTNALLPYFHTPVKIFFEKNSPTQEKAAHAQIQEETQGQHGGDQRGAAIAEQWQGNPDNRH